MPSDWEPERGQECWSDREAWRGEVHLEGAELWRREAGGGEVWADADNDLWETTVMEGEDPPEQTAPGDDARGP